ncbi:Bacterial capsule synthesis protein PGA_cap [uncultured archaeon]|nr:Bacterial capsule synthesis protein PGA_cap [uncultured archaeon]
MKNSVTFAIVGDCAGWNLPEKIDPLSNVRETLQTADVFLFNLEGPVIHPLNKIKITGFPTLKIMRYALKKLGKLQPPVYSIPDFLSYMKPCSINIALLANNHILDAGENGLSETIKHLKDNKILYTGAGENEIIARQPIIITSNGLTIGIINLNLIGWTIFGKYFNIFGAKKRKPGSSFYTPNELEKEIKILDGKVDSIIVSIHMGKAFKKEIPKKHMEYFSILYSNKIDLIVGHHSHVFGELVHINGRNVITSLGDFIFNHGSKHPQPETKVAFLTLEKNKTPILTLKSGTLENGIPLLK